MLNHFDYVAIILFIALMLVASSVEAGTVDTSNGQVTGWHSTRCAAPATPSELSADPETAANDVNGYVVRLNAYADAEHAYMQCISDEAKHDADAAGNAVVISAQAAIDAEQKKVEMLENGLKPQNR